HENVTQIADKLMPPPAGIADDEERENLLELAQAFAEAGDQALAYEGKQITATANGNKFSLNPFYSSRQGG
ncbi:MAG: hypothetical protein F6K41_37500, partial [Symploca sp. SIO3E6]|nr:hypothetical protein [Caldora sp. SIO3E6]